MNDNYLFHSTPVFHVGFPKAGSTSLQHQVLSCLQTVDYFGLYPLKRGAGPEGKAATLPIFNGTAVREFYTEVFMRDGLNYSAERAQSLLKSIHEMSTGGRPVFSHERAIGLMFAYPDLVAKAERLKALFGKLRVLIIIREQLAILKSQYRDHPFDPRNPSEGRPLCFAEWVAEIRKLRYFRLTDALHYDHVAEVYASLFGRENVLVLPLELMIAEPAIFATRLGTLMGVDPVDIQNCLGHEPANRGGSESMVRRKQLIRRLPWLMYFRHMFPDSVVQALKKVMDCKKQGNDALSPELLRSLAEDFGKSNVRLAATWDLNLESLGYWTF